MLRGIKRSILMVFLLISSIGLVISILGYLCAVAGYENALLQWIFSPILGIPVVFVPAVIVAVSKTVKYKGEYLFGIRFWPAIRKAPKIFAILIYLLLANLITMILLRYLGHGKDLLILSSGTVIFYYIPSLIFLSTLIE